MLYKVIPSFAPSYFKLSVGQTVTIQVKKSQPETPLNLSLV